LLLPLSFSSFAISFAFSSFAIAFASSSFAIAFAFLVVIPEGDLLLSLSLPLSFLSLSFRSLAEESAVILVLSLADNKNVISTEAAHSLIVERSTRP
jgi:hypothetical protein